MAAMAGQKMRTPRLEVRLKGDETVRLTRRARERITPGASRTPRLHQFSQSARLQKELLAASQMMPEPEPESEVTDLVVPPKRSLAEERANVKRNLAMKAQTPSLRAKAVAKAALESPWPSKNVSAPRQMSKGRATERGANTEDDNTQWAGRPVAGRPDELTQRAPAAKIAELLGGLEQLADNAVVQRVLENSIAGHSGLYIPSRERMVSRWATAKQLVRTKSFLQSGAKTEGASGTNVMAATPAHYKAEPAPVGSIGVSDAQIPPEPELSSEDRSMFKRISAVTRAQVSSPRTAVAKPGMSDDQSSRNSGSDHSMADAHAIPGLVAPAPGGLAANKSNPEAVRQLRRVLQVHPATAHKHFTAEHLAAIHGLIVDGMPIKPNSKEPTLSVSAFSVSVTSSVPGEFENIHAGDVITIIVDGQPVRRKVLVEEQPSEPPTPVAAQSSTAETSMPRMSRAILKAIFEQLDQNGDGVVDEQELLTSVAADETLAQLLHLPPASPREGGRFGRDNAMEGGHTPEDNVASVRAVMTDVVRTSKQNHDAAIKTAMINLVSPRGGGASESRCHLGLADGQVADSPLGISTVAMCIPEREVLEAMEPDAVRQLALDLGIPSEQVGAAAAPRQVGFEEFAQFLESLVSSAATTRQWSRRAATTQRGRPDSPDVLQVDAPFSAEDLTGVTYTVSRHLRPVAEWRLDVDLPGVDRPDCITWEAAGVLPPQVRSDIEQEELEAAMMLAQLTPRMETVNRKKSNEVAAAEKGLTTRVARPPKDQRVYKGPASLRGRRMRAVGASPGTWKC